MMIVYQWSVWHQCVYANISTGKPCLFVYRQPAEYGYRSVRKSIDNKTAKWLITDQVVRIHTGQWQISVSIVLHCYWAVGGILAILFSTTSFCVIGDSYSGKAVLNSSCIPVANGKEFLNKKTSVLMELLWLTVGNIISIFLPVVNHYRLLVGRKSVVVKKDGEFVIFYACGDTITLLLHLSLL